MIIDKGKIDKKKFDFVKQKMKGIEKQYYISGVDVIRYGRLWENLLKK